MSLEQHYLLNRFLYTLHSNIKLPLSIAFPLPLTHTLLIPRLNRPARLLCLLVGLLLLQQQAGSFATNCLLYSLCEPCPRGPTCKLAVSIALTLNIPHTLLITRLDHPDRLVCLQRQACFFARDWLSSSLCEPYLPESTCRLAC